MCPGHMVARWAVDGGLVDGHAAAADGLQGLGHVLLGPMDGCRLGQLDSNLFAATVESSAGNAVLCCCFLNGRS